MVVVLVLLGWISLWLSFVVISILRRRGTVSWPCGWASEVWRRRRRRGGGASGDGGEGGDEGSRETLVASVWLLVSFCSARLVRARLPLLHPDELRLNARGMAGTGGTATTPFGGLSTPRSAAAGRGGSVLTFWAPWVASPFTETLIARLRYLDIDMDREMTGFPNVVACR